MAGMAPEEKLQKTLVRGILLTPVVIVVLLTVYAEMAWRGYWWFAPAEQPIQFPHSLHAGIRDIDCAYCHRGANDGYYAGVPSVTDCWQCHNGVRGQGTNGESVIDRPEVKNKLIADYVETQKDIKWFKYYDMPEHVKFSHKAHINAGKQCLECHGDVAKMDVIKMKEKPIMGWCVSCHRANNAPTDCTTCHR